MEYVRCLERSSSNINVQIELFILPIASCVTVSSNSWHYCTDINIMLIHCLTVSLK